MVAAQIELTDSELNALRALALSTGKSQEELLRDAVERFLGTLENANRLSLLRQARGIWKDREDLPDLRELRSEFDRQQEIQ